MKLPSLKLCDIWAMPHSEDEKANLRNYETRVLIFSIMLYPWTVSRNSIDGPTSKTQGQLIPLCKIVLMLFVKLGTI